MGLKQDIFFYAGQNSDDSFEILEQGDYLYAENLDNLSVDGNNKQVSQVTRRGNVRVPVPESWMNPVGFEIYEYATTPPYTTPREVIGSVVNEVTNKVYVFLRETIMQQVAYDKTVEQIPPIATLNYRTILEYDHTKKEFTNLVVRTPLAIFSFTESIKWGNVIRGHLTWTQLSTENPKEIEIERAINFTKNQLFLVEGQEFLVNSYSSMTLREFDVIRVPPTNPPRYHYDTDETILTNNIRGNLFQFRCRYVYIDGSESVWSPISKVVLPPNEFNILGQWLEQISNKIVVEVERDSQEIKEIILASRTLTEDGELSTWKVFTSEEIFDYSDFLITVDFYNDVEERVIAESESAKIYDSVPLVAGTQEVISNPDRLIYGNIKDQFIDNIEVSAELEIIENEFIEEVEGQDVGALVNKIPITKGFLGAYNAQTPTSWLSRYSLGLIGDGILQTIRLPKIEYEPLIESMSIVRLRLTVSIGGKNYYYTTPSIDVGVITTYNDFKQAIINGINSDFTDVVGVGAFTDYNSWKAVCTTTNELNNDFRKVLPDAGYIENSVWNVFPDAIFIRLGAIIKAKSGEINNPNFYPQTVHKFENYGTTSAARYYMGYVVGDYYVNGTLKGESQTYDAYIGQELWLVGGDNTGNYAVKKVITTPIGGHDLEYNYKLEGANISSNLIKPTLTPFGRYAVGMVYLDEKRRPITYVQNIEEIYIDRLDEDYAKHITYDIELTINHIAPNKAFYWIPVITNNLNQSTFTEVDLNIDIKEEVDGVLVSVDLVTDEGEFIGIDVNKAIIAWSEKFKNIEGVYKTFNPANIKEGWRILLYNKTAGEYIDREIIDVTDGGALLIQKVGLTDDNIEDTIVRFYKPQKTFGQNIYYEVGDIMTLSPAKLHITTNGQSQSPTIGTGIIPCIHKLNFGDIYISSINYYNATEEGVYTPTYNEFFVPFYQSKLNSKGRVHIKQNVVKTAPYQSRLRYGNAFIQGANFMGLTSFDSLDLVDLPEKHGTIRGLAEVGYTLKVIMDTKPVSIYLQRTLSVDPVGEENVLLTQSAIGTVRIPENNYGTIYPDTIIKKDRAVYWLDVYNGCVVRDAANGQYPISDYKYSSYIKEFCEFVKNNPNNLKLFSTFQKGKNELYIIVKIPSSSSLEMPQSRGNVIVFSEKVNRWTGHLRKNNNAGVQPEWAEAIGDNYLTFLQGELYIEEIDEENKLFFYDKEHDAFISFVFNEHPKKIKIPLALSIQSNKLWHCKNNGDITIPANENYKEMSSRILPSKFKKVEGKFYSEFMKDGNSRANYQEGVVSGRALRGSVALITLRANDKDAKLFSATIRYITSERSY